ncbi:MAG: pyruvate oxidase [Lactobacillaceae bacterium]|jgi:pyruvate oxidase|nr:pyruvate oxidase [Lactobacillaceae bacterium]
MSNTKVKYDASTKIPAAVAMMKVIEAWGVNNIYGYPGGSFSSTMHALDVEKDNINFVHIRHEQVGALAASAEAKLTGKLGVAFGSAGPGAVNLLDGLYDAREDHAPVLALVGQVPSTKMNYDFFQEFNEAPIFDDVSVYNRTVMNAESLPYVVDKAIRMAYKHQGVAVVVIPVDFGWEEIDDIPYESATSYHPADQAKLLPQPTTDEINTALAMIKAAKAPVFHVGRGAFGASEELMKVSEKLQIPIITTALAKGIIPDSYVGNLGLVNRAGSISANEALNNADLVIAIGNDFPFAENVYTSHPFQFIQVDIDSSVIGAHHHVDLGIEADGPSFIKALLEQSEEAPKSKIYEAELAQNKDWRAYLKKLMDKETNPIEYEQVYKQIARIAEDDAVFGIDVGDNVVNTVRFLDVKPQQKWTTSALFATMGYGVPAAIAGKLAFPERQVFNIAGDGAFSMVMQDLLTETLHELPIINIITSNKTLSFIKNSQADLPMNPSGVDILDADYAKIAEGMGVVGISVHTFAELAPAFDKAVATTKEGRPVLLDIKIRDKRGFPVEAMDMDPEKTSQASVDAFKEKYDAMELKPLKDYFAEYGVEL